MFVSRGNNGTVVVTDWRLKTDRELDESEPDEGTHVLSFWKLGRFCFGRAYHRITRVALFDYGETPSNADAAYRRAKLVAWLQEVKPKRVFIVPTPDSTMGADAVALKGTHCWAALRAPDTLEAMRGTRWAYGDSEVVALYPIAKRVKELQKWAMANWLRAHEMPTLKLCDIHTEVAPGEHMVWLLEQMRGQALAVDLEFNPTTDIVTAIGVSDGAYAVSVPWDRYIPRNNEGWERGITDYGPISSRIIALLRDLLCADTPKVAHNFVADIPRLEARMFRVNGKLHDTYAAHAVAFPELRHGLQHAAASMLPVPPWKSLYKPSRLAKGITRDDADFWIADPKALRSYNVKDAFYTWHLARSVLPHVGAELQAMRS